MKLVTILVICLLAIAGIRYYYAGETDEARAQLRIAQAERQRALDIALSAADETERVRFERAAVTRQEASVREQAATAVRQAQEVAARETARRRELEAAHAADVAQLPALTDEEAAVRRDETLVSLYGESGLLLQLRAALEAATGRRIIASQDEQIGALEAEVSAERQVSASLSRELAVERWYTARLEDEVAAMQRLHLASAAEIAHWQALDKARSRSSFWGRLRPKFGIGAAVGVDVTGKPNAVAGATLGWTF